MTKDEVMNVIGEELTTLVDNLYPDDNDLGFIFIIAKQNGVGHTDYLSNIKPENTIGVLEETVSNFKQRVDNNIPIIETMQ